MVVSGLYQQHYEMRELENQLCDPFVVMGANKTKMPGYEKEWFMVVKD